MPTINPFPPEIAYRRKRLERFYPFSVLPSTIRNTFAGATIVHENPGVMLTTAGAVIETNKMIELQVERELTDEFVEGFNNKDAFGYLSAIGCQFWSHPFTAANIDEAAFVGIQWCGFGTAPPFADPAGQALVQLRQHLKTKGTWDLVASMGDGTPNQIATLTDVPFVPTGEGHRVMLVSDPFAPSVYGLIDDRVIGPLPVQFELANRFVLNTQWSGFFITSGVQTGACVIQAMFSSFHSGQYDTHGPGSP
jgi:hypothetical protein